MLNFIYLIDKLRYMLLKQLKIIKEHLQNIKEKDLDENQKELLNELNFIDEKLSQNDYSKYRYQKLLLESFSVAPKNCPTCGKKF